MKRHVGKTYCYDNFITEEEQKTLRKYILSIQDMMGHATSNGYKPEYDMLIRRSIGTVALKEQYNLDPHPLVEDIRNRIIELEGLHHPIIHDPTLGDWFGITDEDAFVEPHTDLVSEPYLDYNIRRYNVIISMPNEGGQPIYDGDILEVGERVLWMCEASLCKHASVPNEGSRMRLNISYGFYIPKNQYNED
jgi:hypothetical protein